MQHCIKFLHLLNFVIFMGKLVVGLIIIEKKKSGI